MQNKSKLPENQNGKNADQQNSEINKPEELIENSPFIEYDQNIYDERSIDEQGLVSVPIGWSCLVLIIINVIGLGLYFYFS